MSFTPSSFSTPPFAIRRKNSNPSEFDLSDTNLESRYEDLLKSGRFTNSLPPIGHQTTFNQNDRSPARSIPQRSNSFSKAATALGINEAPSLGKSQSRHHSTPTDIVQFSRPRTESFEIFDLDPPYSYSEKKDTHDKDLMFSKGVSALLILGDTETAKQLSQEISSARTAVFITLLISAIQEKSDEKRQILLEDLLEDNAQDPEYKKVLQDTIEKIYKS